MIRLIEKTDNDVIADGSVTLPLEKRIKCRLKVTLDDGREAGIFLPRGETMKDGEHLRSEEGEIILVVAADETVSSVFTDDSLLMARLCYHLGNRHMPLQIQQGLVRYQHDHVLDEMVQGLGADVVVEQAPFEPEPGAYGGSAAAGHAHGDHSHHHHSH